MTREEMLAKLGISDEDFRDFLRKLEAFRRSLNPAQLEFFHRNLPTAIQVAEAFGPTATVEEVEALFVEAPPVAGVVCFLWTQKPGGPGSKK